VRSSSRGPEQTVWFLTIARCFLTSSEDSDKPGLVQCSSSLVVWKWSRGVCFCFSPGSRSALEEEEEEEEEAEQQCSQPGDCV
jgi:hypothetical protein